MKFFLFSRLSKNPSDKKGEEKLVAIQEPEYNTNEGSEFLDDAIRMREQPLVRTEVSIAAGNPQDLL